MGSCSSITASTLVSICFLFLCLTSPSSGSASSNLLDAADILSAAGYECMALHLELASQTLEAHHSLTIFAPQDTAFQRHPHLHLSLLRYHLLPHAFSLHSLTSLPFGASIPTLLPGHSLTITTTTPLSSISINNITINPTPIFQHPNLSIFSTNTFFNLHQQQHPHPHPPPPPNPATCPPPSLHNPLSNASHLLHSHGYSLISALLDLQFPSPSTRRRLTLFAPPDHSIANLNLTLLPPLLLRHLVPCSLTWRDLQTLQDGTFIGTYERGFAINVTNPNNGHPLLLNGVAVVFPEIYRGDWLVVHGVNHVLSGDHHHGKRHRHNSYRVSVAEERDADADADADADDDDSSASEFDAEGNSANHYHFSVYH